MDNLFFSNLVSQTSSPQIHSPHFLEDIDFPTHHMWADTQFEIIKKHITEFQDNLDSEHEVGVLLTNFGQNILMHVEQVGYEKSVVMVFKGKVNGQPATLIQHINQLSFLLTSLSKEDETKPPRRIGFVKA